jgi:hypothetical protein
MALAPGKYYVNTVMRLTSHFENDAGTDVDPSTVTFKLRSPSGVETSLVYGTDSDIGKSSVGDYYADFTPDEAGRWFYRWESTGTGTTIATEGNFLIQYSPFYDTFGSDYGI